MKNKRSSKVFGAIEGVYGRIWLMGKGGGSIKCKGGYGEVQRMNECWSKKAREIGYSRGKRL